MAVTIDIGECLQCKERNSKTLQNCRKCGAMLPWAKAPKVAKASSGVEFAIPPLQIVGGLVFVLGVVLWCGNVFGFFPTFRGLGYIVMIAGGALFKAGWDS